MFICIACLWLKLNKLKDVQHRCISILKTCIIDKTLRPAQFEDYLKQHRLDKSADTEAHSRAVSFRIVENDSPQARPSRAIEADIYDNVPKKQDRKYDGVSVKETVQYATLKKHDEKLQEMLMQRLHLKTYENPWPKFQMSTAYPNVKSVRKSEQIPMRNLDQKIYEELSSNFTKVQKQNLLPLESPLDRVTRNEINKQTSSSKKSYLGHRKYAQIMDLSVSLPSNINDTDSLRDLSINAQLGSLHSSLSEPIYSRPRKPVRQKYLSKPPFPAKLNSQVPGLKEEESMAAALNLSEKFHSTIKNNQGRSIKSKYSDFYSLRINEVSVDDNMNVEQNDSCLACGDQTDYYEMPWGNSLNLNRINYSHSIHKLPSHERNENHQTEKLESAFPKSLESVPGLDSLEWDNYQPLLLNSKNKLPKGSVIVQINPEINECWV